MEIKTLLKASSHPVFIGVRVTQILALCVLFCRSLALCVLFCRSLALCVLFCRSLALCVLFCRSLALCVLFCRSLFVFWSFLSFGHCIICPSSISLLITPLVSSDYPFGIFWLPLWYLLITPLISSDYPFGIFWLPLWYLLITPLVSSDYPFGIFWLLHMGINCVIFMAVIWVLTVFHSWQSYGYWQCFIYRRFVP